MKTNLTRTNPALLCVIAFTLSSMPQARAGFHLWDVVEIYSSADGLVQFIEMKAQGGSQQNLGCCGAKITSTNSSGSTEFAFPSSLSGDSAGKSCIIGTTNLAVTPGGVTPDYIIPVNFIRRPVAGSSAAVIFSGNASTAVFTNLPTDGRGALLRSGSSMVVVSTNSPRNYSNQSNSIVPVKFASADLGGGSFQLSFATASGPNNGTGPNYAVEAVGQVNSNNWTVVSNVTGNGTVKSIAIPIATQSNRFFRLRVP